MTTIGLQMYHFLYIIGNVGYRHGVKVGIAEFCN